MFRYIHINIHIIYLFQKYLLLISFIFYLFSLICVRLNIIHLYLCLYKSTGLPRTITLFKKGRFYILLINSNCNFQVEILRVMKKRHIKLRKCKIKVYYVLSIKLLFLVFTHTPCYKLGTTPFTHICMPHKLTSFCVLSSLQKKGQVYIVPYTCKGSDHTAYI
jgi:hypothetical protein